MPLAVIVDDDVQVCARRPRGVGQAVGHPGGQLTAVQIGDQIVAAVAVESRRDRQPRRPAGAAYASRSGPVGDSG